MFLNSKLRFFVTTIAFWFLLQGVRVSVWESAVDTQIQIGTEALAKKSGGRSRGGSFGSSGSSSRSRSSGSSSSGSRSSGSSPSTKTRPSSSQNTGNNSSSNPSTTGGRVRGGSFTPSAPPPPRPVTPPPPRPQAAPPPPRPVTPPPPRPVVPIPVPVPVPITGDRQPSGVFPNNQPPPQPTGNPTGNIEPSEPSLHNSSNSNPVNSRDRQSNPSATGAVYGNYGSSRTNWMGFMLWLLIIGGGLFIAYLIFSHRHSNQAVGNELDNDIVTVSKLQVALLVREGDIQQQLTELTVNGDTETPEGLIDLLQESALVLMRSSDRWCYVCSTSQTVNSRQEAQQLFEQLSLEERSKLSAETLVNVNGKVQDRLAALSAELSDPGSYVVVTLLVGTADDRPLFAEAKTTEELKATLSRLGAVSSDYLMVFELIWSPQEETMSLSDDELLVSYGNMLPL